MPASGCRGILEYHDVEILISNRNIYHYSSCLTYRVDESIAFCISWPNEMSIWSDDNVGLAGIVPAFSLWYQWTHINANKAQTVSLVHTVWIPPLQSGACRHWLKVGTSSRSNVSSRGVIDLAVHFVRIALVERAAQNEQTRKTKAKKANKSSRSRCFANIGILSPVFSKSDEQWRTNGWRKEWMNEQRCVSLCCEWFHDQNDANTKQTYHCPPGRVPLGWGCWIA